MPARRPRRLAVVGLVSLTAAELFSGAYTSNEGFITEGLCGEESAICTAPGEISSVSSATNDLPIAKTEGKWARGKRPKRRRRVGFSHEDVAGDEFLRPFVQAFRDSLSGSAKGAGFTAEQDIAELLGPRDTSLPAADEAHEVGDVRDNCVRTGTLNSVPRIVNSVLLVYTRREPNGAIRREYLSLARTTHEV